jgi:ankyrin repeat protein
MFAAMNGHLDIVRMLLEKGAKVDAINYSGENALMLASSNGHRDVEELLIQAEEPGGVLNTIRSGDLSSETEVQG